MVEILTRPQILQNVHTFHIAINYILEPKIGSDDVTQQLFN